MFRLLPRSSALAVSAVHLLRACGLFAWLARDGAFGLLECALDLVLEMRLCLVSSRCALLSDACACCALLGHCLLTSWLRGSGLALALGSG